MPTPTGDRVSLAIQQTLSIRKGGGSDIIRNGEESDLDSLVNGGCQQAMFTNVEYELAENQHATSEKAIKAKYLCLSSGSVSEIKNYQNPSPLGNSNLVNGGSPKNGTSNRVKSNPDSVLPQPAQVLFPPEKVVLGWKGKGPNGAGMQNLGNTCYLNSILQALFHVPALVSWLQEDTDHRQKCEKENGPTYGDCITCSLAKTLQSSRSCTSFIRPELITSKLKLICRNMMHGAEEDAHEFMRFLLENVEKQFLKRFPKHLKLDSYSRETTPINQIFGGYLRTEVTCKRCGNVSTTFQHFQDLLLDIRKVSRVDEAFDLYFSRELLDGISGYRCEKCNQVVQATKKFSIEKPPKVLCVQLKRFTGQGGKIQKSVEVRQHISLHKYLNSASSYKNGPLDYKLISMVTHSGNSPGGGHYTAIAETPSSNFCLFDDACVRPVNLSSVTNTGAYILFFEMHQPQSRQSFINQVRNIERNFDVSKHTSSTVTSNGNGMSNGSSLNPFKKNMNSWPGNTSTTQSSALSRMVISPKKTKTLLGEKAIAAAANTVNGSHENRTGFIGPRLPTDTKVLKERAEKRPLNHSWNEPVTRTTDDDRKRLTDGVVRIVAEKSNAKIANSLVPYVCNEDSSSSKSSLSPTQEENEPSKSDLLSVKATNANFWHVSHSPAPVRSPSSISGESNNSGTTSTVAGWNVTRRLSPADATCSSDTEADARPSIDSAHLRASSVDRTLAPTTQNPAPVPVPPPVPAMTALPAATPTKSWLPQPSQNQGLSDDAHPSDGLNGNDSSSKNAQRKFKKRNDAEVGGSSSSESGSSSKERYFAFQNRKQEHFYNHQRNNSNSSNWRSEGSMGHNNVNNGFYGHMNGSGDRNFNRPNGHMRFTPNGSSADRNSQSSGYGVSSQSKGSYNVDSILNRLKGNSHMGLDRVRTWHGGKSSFDRNTEDRMRSKRTSDYDDEMDRGKVKKARHHRNDFGGPNHFNNHQQKGYNTPQQYRHYSSPKKNFFRKPGNFRHNYKPNSYRPFNRSY